MLFNTPPDPSRAAYESEILNAFKTQMALATSRDIFKLSPKIDQFVLPKLSGRNILEVAKTIELQSPASIDNIPRLRKLRTHAEIAAELSQILSPVSLSQVIAALSYEEDKGD